MAACHHFQPWLLDAIRLLPWLPIPNYPKLRCSLRWIRWAHGNTWSAVWFLLVADLTRKRWDRLETQIQSPHHKFEPNWMKVSWVPTLLKKKIYGCLWASVTRIIACYHLCVMDHMKRPSLYIKSGNPWDRLPSMELKISLSGEVRKIIILKIAFERGNMYG